MIHALIMNLPWLVAGAAALAAYALGHRDGEKAGKERGDAERYVDGYQAASADIAAVLEDQARVSGRDVAAASAAHLARQRTKLGEAAGSPRQ